MKKWHAFKTTTLLRFALSSTLFLDDWEFAPDAPAEAGWGGRSGSLPRGIHAEIRSMRTTMLVLHVAVTLKKVDDGHLTPNQKASR